MKKAILLVSFGTTFLDTKIHTLDRIEEKVKKAFKGYEIRSAFTSRKVIFKLKHRYSIDVDNPEEALLKLKAEGFEEVIVQSLHIIPGKEYGSLNNLVQAHLVAETFKKISLGRPALWLGNNSESMNEYYESFIEAIKDIIPREGTTVFMGHGTTHEANDCYNMLVQIMRSKGYKNIYLANLEAPPTIKDVIPQLKEAQVEELTIIPLMLLAGRHVKLDMAGERDDSWKNILETEGFKVNLWLRSLGELEDFQDLYINHIRKLL
jgi:sirohydrochlorin cobaltochelatase